MLRRRSLDIRMEATQSLPWSLLAWLTQLCSSSAHSNPPARWPAGRCLGRCGSLGEQQAASAQSERADTTSCQKFEVEGGGERRTSGDVIGVCSQFLRGCRLHCSCCGSAMAPCRGASRARAAAERPMVPPATSRVAYRAVNLISLAMIK